MLDELTTAWRTNNRINLMLIDRISAEGMRCTLSKRGGRGVAGEFAHMHNVRLMQLQKRARDLAEGLSKFPTGYVPSKAELKKALTASASAIEEFLVGVFEKRPKRRGFKRGIFATLSYFVTHEAHHRGRILLTLKVSSHTLERDTQMAIWDWDRL
jgi:uncharacterized damage-inducible protein DinB